MIAIRRNKSSEVCVTFCDKFMGHVVDIESFSELEPIGCLWSLGTW